MTIIAILYIGYVFAIRLELKNKTMFMKQSAVWCCEMTLGHNFPGWQCILFGSYKVETTLMHYFPEMGLKTVWLMQFDVQFPRVLLQAVWLL